MIIGQVAEALYDQAALGLAHLDVQWQITLEAYPTPRAGVKIWAGPRKYGTYLVIDGHCQDPDYVKGVANYLIRKLAIAVQNPQ